MDITWIQTILGVLVGWQLPNIYQFLKYWLYLRWKQHILEGDWHCYHYSGENNICVFRHEIWSITRSPLGGLVICTADHERPKLIYTAKVKYEKGYLLLDFNGVNHPEEWQARLNELIPGNNSQMRGLMVAVDFDRNSYSTPLIVAESELPHEEVKGILRNMSCFDEKTLSLRLKNALANN